MDLMDEIEEYFKKCFKDERLVWEEAKTNSN